MSDDPTHADVGDEKDEAVGTDDAGADQANQVDEVDDAGDVDDADDVDGNWVPPGTFHLDDISPTMIEAIEIYRGPAEVPAKFRQRETACGLIVIWTREPPPRERSGDDVRGAA